MNGLTAVVILVPSILGFLTSMAYAWLGYKRLKEQEKDEIWETATKMVCSHNNPEADDFANIYQELKLFRDNGCDTKGDTLAHAVIAKREEQRV